MAGQIIIVSGTSGAGKTTTINCFSKRTVEPYLMFGIDNLLGGMLHGKYSMFGEYAKDGMYVSPENADDPESDVRADFGEVGWSAIRAFHEMIAAASRAGQNVVVDHLMFVDPPILQDCIWRLAGLPVLFVAAKPPFEVLMDRLATRTVDIPETMDDVAGQIENDAALTIAKTMQKLTPWFYKASYANDCYDLVIDTDAHNPDEVCRRIESRLEEGPGTAFESLRARYPETRIEAARVANGVQGHLLSPTA
ncbi:phosphotransferase-like protein [Mycolicibacterium fortuitum]|uniref:phosphotransferase-like protein n=1 Tax=Mycolicibacterium fortuitum TaxID=1766 RepID=UPI00090053CA|nr:hypothetical protein [Mycolicibacterium fortuitum]